MHPKRRFCKRKRRIPQKRRRRRRTFRPRFQGQSSNPFTGTCTYAVRCHLHAFPNHAMCRVVHSMKKVKGTIWDTSDGLYASSVDFDVRAATDKLETLFCLQSRKKKTGHGSGGAHHGKSKAASQRADLLDGKMAQNLGITVRSRVRQLLYRFQATQHSHRIVPGLTLKCEPLAVRQSKFKRHRCCGKALRCGSFWWLRCSGGFSCEWML